METIVLRRNLLKTQRNKGFALEHMENIRKQRVCYGTNGKRLENIGFAREPMENEWNTQVLRGNI